MVSLSAMPSTVRMMLLPLTSILEILVVLAQAKEEVTTEEASMFLV